MRWGFAGSSGLNLRLLNIKVCSPARSRFRARVMRPFWPSTCCALSGAVYTGRRRAELRRTRLLLKEVISSVIPALLRVWRVGPSASTVPAFQYTRGVTRASVSVKSLSGKDCNVGGRPEPSLSFSHGIDSESQSIYCRMQSRRNPRSEHSRAKTKTFNVTSELKCLCFKTICSREKR